MILETPLHASGKRRRSGFTLIELLIVITIIAVLAGLLLGAANRVMARAKDVRCRAEIAQLSEALAAFKSKFGRFPPSSCVIGPLGSCDPESKTFLLQCWPRLGPQGLGSGTLTGDQVLVFFLGGQARQIGTTADGYPQYATLGFSTDPVNPMKPLTPGADRIAPFYDFPVDRLDLCTGQNPSFIDAYDVRRTMGVKCPYLYFSSGRQGNDYRTNAIMNQMPMRDPSGNWFNKDTFQIFSAGADGRFGGAGTWSPGRAEQIYPSGYPGFDDMTNFYDLRMGVSR